MAREDIFIRLQVDASDGIAPVAALARSIDSASKELREFKKETKEQTVLTGEQATKMAALETRLHGLRGAYREAKNEQSGLTDAGLRFRDKIGETFNEKLNASVASFGSTLVAALAVGKITEFTKELANLAATNEQLDRRAQVVFGESLPGITAAAAANANQIGLTAREYVALAASQQDVFDNLGLAKDQTVQYLPKLLELSDGLADFAGLEGGAAEAADLLRAAVQGNIKGLTELGIPVKRSKEEMALLADEIQRTKGVTKEQAEALATIELVYDQVGKKVEEFGAGQTTIADKQDTANAKFREAKEALADGLAPAFTLVTQAAGDYVGVIAKVFDGTNGLGERLANLASLANVPLALIKGSLNSAQEAVDKTFTDAENRISEFGANADLSGLREYAAHLKGELVKAMANGQDETAERLKAFFAPGGAIDKALQSATGPKVKVPVDLDLTPNVTTIGELRESLKKLKEERDLLNVSDANALASNTAQITALESQIASIDGTTNATKKLKEETVNAVGSVAAINAEISTLQKSQAQSTTSAQFQTYQAQIDELKKSLVEITAIAAVGALFNPLAAPDTVGQAGSTQEGPLPQDAANAVAGNEQLNAERDAEELLAQQALIDARNQAEIDGKVTLDEQLTILDAEYKAGVIASEEELGKRKAELIQKEVDLRELGMQQSLQLGANLFNTLASMAEENSEEQKALATVAALINTYQGATAALGAPDVLPQPFAVVVKLLSVAAVIASGLASVKKIQGFAGSGVVSQKDGPRYTKNPGDTVLVSAYPGEMYLNHDHQDEIRKRAGYDIFSAAGVPGASGARKSIGGLRGALSKVSRHLGPIQMGVPGFATSGVVPSISGAQVQQINVSNAIRDINFSPQVAVEHIDRGQADMVSVNQLSTL